MPGEKGSRDRNPGWQSPKAHFFCGQGVDLCLSDLKMGYKRIVMPLDGTAPSGMVIFMCQFGKTMVISCLVKHRRYPLLTMTQLTIFQLYSEQKVKYIQWKPYFELMF